MFVWRKRTCLCEDAIVCGFFVHNILPVCELALLAWTSSAPLFFTGMLSGAMMPYALAALTKKSVGEAL